jgi:hypothetical protein
MPDDSVTAALNELREMFPDKWHEIKVSWHLGRYWYWIAVYGKPRQGSGCESLAEAMQIVRAWKEANTK